MTFPLDPNAPLRAEQPMIIEPTVVIATVNTGTYDWTVVAATVAQAEQLLVDAYGRHCANVPSRDRYDIDTQIMRDCVETGGVTFHTVAVGTVLRDDSVVLSPAPFNA